MNSTLRYLLIVVVAALIIVPSVYIVMGLQNSDARATIPTDYIPSDSTAAGMITNNGTTYYPFISNGTVGMVLQASLSSIASGKSAANLNITSSLLLQTSSYRGYSVFKISDLNILSLFNLGANATIMGYVYGFLNQTNLSGITNVSIYASNPSSSVTIVGELQAVYRSIDSYLANDNIDPSMLSSPNNANMSLYYSQTGGNISHISANLTSSNLTVSIGFVSPMLSEAAHLAYLSISPGLFQMKMVGSSTLLITISNQTFMSIANVDNLFRLVKLTGFTL